MRDNTPCPRCKRIERVRYAILVQSQRPARLYYCGSCDHSWQRVQDDQAFPSHEVPPQRSRVTTSVSSLPLASSVAYAPPSSAFPRASPGDVWPALPVRPDLAPVPVSAEARRFFSRFAGGFDAAVDGFTRLGRTASARSSDHNADATRESTDCRSGTGHHVQAGAIQHQRRSLDAVKVGRKRA
jgi:hypothetical protein